MMTEPFWVELAKQVPALLLFVYTVTVFLKHITEERKNVDRVIDGVKEFQRELTRENLAALDKLTGVVERSAAQLALNEQAFRRYRKRTRVVTSREMSS